MVLAASDTRGASPEGSSGDKNNKSGWHQATALVLHRKGIVASAAGGALLLAIAAGPLLNRFPNIMAPHRAPNTIPIASFLYQIAGGSYQK